MSIESLIEGLPFVAGGMYAFMNGLAYLWYDKEKRIAYNELLDERIDDWKREIDKMNLNGIEALKDVKRFQEHKEYISKLPNFPGKPHSDEELRIWLKDMPSGMADTISKWKKEKKEILSPLQLALFGSYYLLKGEVTPFDCVAELMFKKISRPYVTSGKNSKQ